MAPSKPWGTAYLLVYRGWVAIDEHDLRRARDVFVQSLSLAGDLGAEVRVLGALEGIAQLAMLKGQPDIALRLVCAVAVLRVTSGVPLPGLERARVEQMLASARGKLPAAQADLECHAGTALSLSQAIALALDTATGFALS